MIDQASFNPEDWEFKGVLYHYVPDSDEGNEYANFLIDHIEESFGQGRGVCFDPNTAHSLADKDGRYYLKGTCDHCGARFNYGAVFKHKEINRHLIVGHVCATNKLTLSGHEYQDARLRKIIDTARTKYKALMNKKANEAKIAEFDSEIQEALSLDHYICKSIRESFINFGNLTEKQKALILKIYKEHQEKKDVPALEPKPVPVTDERMTFKGTILGLKEVETYDGYITNMVFQDDRGFKIYGTVPIAVWDLSENPRNLRIQFDARVKASDKDECFGFFSRPTKVSKLS